MKAKKQRNNHARSKRKRRLLKLKNFFSRVFDKRSAKMIKANQPKGLTIVGDAKKYATSLEKLFPDGGGGYLFNPERKKYLNQRQKRKRWRQNPHLRKKTA